jgi:hypothetical protein
MIPASHRRNLRDANGLTSAIEVGDYFHNRDGEVAEWLFGAAPLHVKQGLPQFKTPRFTMSGTPCAHRVCLSPCTLGRSPTCRTAGAGALQAATFPGRLCPTGPRRLQTGRASCTRPVPASDNVMHYLSRHATPPAHSIGDGTVHFCPGGVACISVSVNSVLDTVAPTMSKEPARGDTSSADPPVPGCTEYSCGVFCRAHCVWNLLLWGRDR